MKKTLILSAFLFSNFAIVPLAFAAQSIPMTFTFSFILDRDATVDNINLAPTITVDSYYGLEKVCSDNKNLGNIALSRVNNNYTYTYTVPANCLVDAYSTANFTVTIPQNSINSDSVPFTHKEIKNTLSTYEGAPIPRQALEFKVLKSGDGNQQLYWYTLDGAQRP